ncbi:hypothetical protein CAEBREN_20291 [Caenorhabditis brenneri]|uniref:Serpentine receptor class r-10 n=1 Tax=Caenorhabditis brenneri TaxID=135651 RepID=G0ML97_CAEBE|nr:hypothetical protein CAEBREN_20291 [Caenorhabditis brenneri]
MKFASSRLIFQRSIASLGVLNNLILILLIIFKSPKQLGHYKYLMGYITIFEILYSILDFVSVPEIFSKDSIFVIVIYKKLAFLPEVLLKYANMAFCSLFGMSMAIFAIHFVYRYLIVTGSRFLQKKHFQKVMSLILFTVFVGFIWSIATNIFLNNNVYSDAKLSNDYLNSRNVTLEEIDYVGAHFHQIDSSGVEFINWKSMGAVLIMTIVIFLSFSTVFYCGLEIYNRIRIMSSIQSSGTKNLQSQLFWALVFQTMIPVFLMHIPASIGFITSMCNQTTEVLGETTEWTIFMYPALDPLPNFFIIKSFRQAILEFIGCMRKSVVPPNATNSKKATGNTIPLH